MVTQMIKKRLRRCVLAVLIALTVPNTVSAKEDEKKEAWVPPLRIMMPEFEVPVAKKYPPTVPLTVILQAKNIDYLGPICKKMPRIRDAIVMAMYSPKIDSKDGKLVLNGVDKRFLKAVNRSLGKRYVHSIVLVDGSVKALSGGINSLPFAVARGCRAIEEWETEKVAKEKEK